MGTSICTFCSVKMFRSGAYKDENGEMVRVDYIRDIDKYCKEHCEYYKPEVEVYLENSSYDKSIKREVLKILKEEPDWSDVEKTFQMGIDYHKQLIEKENKKGQNLLSKNYPTNHPNDIINYRKTGNKNNE